MAKVDLTEAQAKVAVQALDSYLMAGSWEECVAIFGSAGGVEAARRARDKLTPVGYASAIRNASATAREAR
jgi:hypothetical protein